MQYTYVLTSLLVICLTKTTFACKGCVSLDELNFDKIVPRFKATLVKFDVAFPYGDKHEVFGKFAEETALTSDLILAQVGVKDYGDKENEVLATKYGITKDDYPAVRLFKSDTKTPIAFDKDAEFTLDNLRNLIRDNTDIYIGLPGCLEKYDKLAADFLKAKDKKDKLKEAESSVKGLEEREQSISKTYITYMKKVIEVGVIFIKQEKERLSKILKGKINSTKQKELQYKLNILHSFSSVRDEL